MTENDATAWFEPLYAAANRGERIIPWDRGAPHPNIVQWAANRQPTANGKRAVVVGSGTGDDAEFIASLGYDTVAFDIASSAIDAARTRYPDTSVDYRQADLLDLPPHWLGHFDLVVEHMTVQSLPVDLHSRATAGVASMVAPAGTLLMLASARQDDAITPDGPPWPLSRQEVEAFGADLRTVAIERRAAPDHLTSQRWIAEFTRD